MASLFRDLLSAALTGLRAPLAVRPGDIALFVHSSRTDAAVLAAQQTMGVRAAFESIYRNSADPWRSASPRYGYQRRKYETLIGLLPRGRRYRRVLDLGSGLGVLSRLLAGRAAYVLGVDLAQSAVDRAAQASVGFRNIEFRQGDAAALPPDLPGPFDLVVIADTLYYLTAPTDAALDRVVDAISGLLTPGGTIMLANHYFSRWDTESRLSRRIHDRFIISQHFTLRSEHRRPFYLVSMLERTAHAPI